LLVLLAADGYAIWRLSQAAESWSVRLLPGDLPGSLWALTVLLATNAGAILLLLIGTGKE